MKLLVGENAVGIQYSNLFMSYNNEWGFKNFDVVEAITLFAFNGEVDSLVVSRFC